MHVFRVIVPFIAAIRHTLSHSATSRLPSGETVLSGMVLRVANDGQCSATVEVEATDPATAKALGAETTEGLLKLLAISGDLFEVNYSMVDAKVLREVEPRQPTITQQGNVTQVTLADQVFMQGHLGSVKIKGNLNFEAQAFADMDRWPVHLRRGIDLNYSAVRAATEDIRFFLWASTLEILAWKKLGSPDKLIRSTMNRATYTSFRTRLAEFLKTWGLTDNAVDRLGNQLLATNKDPVARHILDYLQKIGVTGYEQAEVSDWWKMRGRVAHGEAIPDETLRILLPRIEQAVRDALTAELNLLAPSSSTTG